MARIHLLEVDIPNIGDAGIQSGTIRVVFHVNISAQKNENVDVSERIDVGQLNPGGRLQSGTVRVGPSIIGPQLGTHPEFSPTLETVSLASQDLAEVEAQIQLNEGETLATAKSIAEGFYANIEGQAQALYAAKFAMYSEVSNDLPA